MKIKERAPHLHQLSASLTRTRLSLAAAVPACVLLARHRRRLGLPPAVSLPLAAAVPAAAVAVSPRGRVRAGVGWASFMWAYKVAFEIPHDRPERQYRRLHVDEPIAVDRGLGRGEVPSAILQRRLRRPPKLTALDRAAALFYSTWEAAPHLTLAWILARRPRRFPAAALRIGATFAATVPCYFAYPAAPPWWASEREGRIGGAVRRVTLEVKKDMRDEPRPGTDHGTGANPWASMPSDHLASSAMTAAILAEIDPRLGAAGAAYTALLGATLVYTGEHYVVDLAAGLALPAAIYGAAVPIKTALDRRG